MTRVLIHSLVACSLASWVSGSAIGGCAGGRTGTEKEEMKAERQNEDSVHFFVSNQSLAVDPTSIEVGLDGRQIFQRELRTGTQHTWERATISVSPGKHTMTVREAKTQTHRSQELDVSRELWVVIRFLGPTQLKVDVFDHPVGLM
jgi:hypothetical protein